MKAVANDIVDYPEDWEIAPLGEITDMIMGQSPPSSTYNEDGNGIPFLQGKAEFQFRHPKHIKYTTSPVKVAPSGTILMSVRAPVGDVNIADIEYCIGRGLGALSLINGSNEFLFYLLAFNKSEIAKEGTGSIFKSISKNVLAGIKVALPPLPEQKKIAAVLSAIQEAKEKTDNVIFALKQLKKSMMKHLFTYGAVPIEDVGRVKLKETEIGRMPESWEVPRIEEVIILSQYGLSVRGNPQGRYPILRMNSMQSGKLILSDLQYVDLEEGLFKKYKLNKGDLLFNRTNSYELVGKVSIFEEDVDFVFASYLVRMTVDRSRILPEFLNHYLNWLPSQERLKMLASRGVSQSNINATKMKALHIALPSLEEQQIVIDILSAIDRKIDAENGRKNSLNAVFNTLLSLLMTGKLRVNQLEI